MTNALRQKVIDALTGLSDREVRAVLRLVQSRSGRQPSRKRTKKPSSMRDLPAFGMWKDRKDIKDSASYATQLRDAVWGRRR